MLRVPARWRLTVILGLTALGTCLLCPRMSGGRALLSSLSSFAHLRSRSGYVAGHAPGRHGGVTYQWITVAGIPMHVVRVDPRDPDVCVTVATAGGGIGRTDGWAAMIDRAGPVAAVTGTYFCTRSGVPVGSIISGGRQIHEGLVGTAFAFKGGRGARLVNCRPGARGDWNAYDTVLRAGPRLLSGGRRVLWPRGEGFHDPDLFGPRRRTAVALTPDGDLLLVAVDTPVLMRTLADALRQLGAADAMCLDGGRSTGLYYRGKTWVKPRRPLTNLLVVYDSAARYRERAGRLNPAGPVIVQARPAKRPG